jgi:hypothetical protein
MCFVVGNLFGVVAAPIQGNVDCEDYVSHFASVDTDQLSQSGFEVDEIRRLRNRINE